MLTAYKTALQMVEGDFGLQLPFEIKGATITSSYLQGFYRYMAARVAEMAS